MLAEIRRDRREERPGVPAPAPSTIAPAPTPALPTHIALRAPTALKKPEAVVIPAIVARNDGIGRSLARYESTLGLIAQHRDELGAVVGLGAQRFVRNDDRGSRRCCRCDAIENLLRDGGAVER